MATPRRKPRRLKLRHLLFLILLLSGIIPLLVVSFQLIRQNREILKTQEKVLLTYSAQSLADSLSESLEARSRQLRQLGRGFVAAPGFDALQDRLQEPWVQRYMERYAADHPELLALHAVDAEGVGLRFDSRSLSAPVEKAMEEAMEEARGGSGRVYRFVVLSKDNEAGVTQVVSVPSGPGPDGVDRGSLYLQTLAPLSLADLRGAGEASMEDLFLIDADGGLLWAGGTSTAVDQALMDSDLVRDFSKMPLSVIREYELDLPDGEASILAQLVPVRETGWAVVAYKPAATAFRDVQRMVYNTALVSLLLVGLSFVVAVLAARYFGQPIQRLADTTSEIASGRFEQRVDTSGLRFELADLAEDFNRMSDYVEEYVEQLREAAQQNRELFISSIRAFAAAIDAKDPYTRGHSERVASYSRSIARHLNLAPDLEEKVWISAVLHDVGKIGVDDRVLKKQGMLTPEEFEQMKLHPVIGAEIVGPIFRLREMIPGIRWHHEAWNGSGYPDGLKGEQIPLIPRIIGVADTFDAITTTRPYQQESSPDKAIEIIKKLTGTKFDAKIVTAFLLAWEAGHIRLDRTRVAAQQAVATAKERVASGADLTN